MKRISSIDLLRGLVIMLMALDHTRDMWGMTSFGPEQVDQTTPGFFFTRWITHFCAPVFVFLAGISAFLYGQKVNDRKKLTLFLFTRGLWLVVAEALLVNPGWTFAFPWQSGQVVLQVIWALGWSMIFLSVLVWLPSWIILVFSLVAIAGHNMLDQLPPEYFGQMGWLWEILHVPFGTLNISKAPPLNLIVVYPLIPWIAVMSLGYVCGLLYKTDTQQRRRSLLAVGFVLLVMFVLLRGINRYGDPYQWNEQARGGFYTFLDFLNVTKYPPSLLYCCLTLGAAFLLLCLFEKWEGLTARIVLVYGQVPFFFYLLHTPLLNFSARIYHYIRYGRAFSFVGTPQDQWPTEYRPQLWLVYLAWAGALLLLYFVCRWYARYKATHNYWWLKYI